MTILETKQRIEKELAAVAESFGDASALVNYSVEVEVNQIEGAPEDITYVFGSLSIGPEGAEDNDRLYLPLDAELDDNDNVDEAAFEESLAKFRARVDAIRSQILASDDYNKAAANIIADFDREMDEKYRAEIDRLNKVAKRNLTIASVSAAAAALIAIIILVIDKIA